MSQARFVTNRFIASRRSFRDYLLEQRFLG